MNDKSPLSAKEPVTLRQAVCWALVLSSMISTPVLSAQTDISSSPITSINAAQVKPNVMLLVDASGSMGWGHMPDEMESVVGINSIGYKASQCNVIYYNPNLTYALPKQADGTPFTAPPFSNAPYDGYSAFNGASTATVNLQSAFKAYDDFTLRTSGYNDTPQQAYYYTYTANSGTAPVVAYNSAPCADNDVNMTVPSADGPAPGGLNWAGTWTRVLVSSSSGVGSTDERQNFATWYSFYRTRILLIKSAASLAFTPLTDSFRVGFITVKPKDHPYDAAINANKYLAIDDFNTTQRGLWFSKVFSQVPGGSSPTREGLARVGRMYAGKHDGINTGMDDDPVQSACQQNFTIMTTDGYWNGQDESTPQGAFIGGPVDMSGQHLVGEQDGSLDAQTNNNPSPPPAADFDGTPRPIWDGTYTGNRTITNETVHYSYVPCGTYFNMSTTTLNKSTSQLQAETIQTTQRTTQTLQSTTQMLSTTQQTLTSTSQTKIATQQNLQTTTQNLQTTTQNLFSTNQFMLVQTKTQMTVRTPMQSTVQNLQSTVQNVASTSQLNQGTTQQLMSTTQTLGRTQQMLQSTTQTTQSMLQITMSTSQIQQSTSQVNISTSQVRRSTSQLRSCDSSTELCTPGPVGSCPGTGTITCDTVTTGPTLVASCTNDPASLANNWTATTCVTTPTGPTPAASCTPDTASPLNSYTTTTCTTLPNPPVAPAPVAACTAATANAGNAYTTTTCVTIPTGPTPVAACVPATANSTNSYTTTTCAGTPSVPVGMPSCTPVAAGPGNSYTATICAPNNTTNVPVQTCAAAPGDNTNGWTTTTCTPNNTVDTPMASCTNAPATGLNAWTQTICTPVNNINVPVDPMTPCVSSAPTFGNGYTTTTCSVNNSPLTPVGACVVASANIGNSYTATICPILTTTNVPVQTCTVSGPTSINNWIDTTCPAAIVANNVPVPSCTNASPSLGNAWTNVVCSNANTTNVAVNTCSPSSAAPVNNWTTTTCPPEVVDSGPTTVATCTPAPATDLNSHQRTDCDVVVTNTPVQPGTCVPDPAGPGNGFVATTCVDNITPNAPIQTCTPQTANLGNGWLEIDCATNNNYSVPVLACSASGPTAANLWVTTSCPAPAVIGPTPVASCTPVAAAGGNFYTATTCPPPVTTSMPVDPALCTPIPASNGNNWIATTCPIVLGTPVAPTCTPAVGDGTNGWTTTTCTPNNQFNVPVPPVPACVNSGPTAANGYTTTTCTPNNVPAHGVPLCSPGLPSLGNGYTTTTCAPNNPPDVASGTCVAVPPTLGNGYTTTSCPIHDSGVVGASSCAPVTGDSTNAWTTVLCPGTAVTGPTATDTCVTGIADSTNSWTATSCNPVTTASTVVTTCNPSTANSTNGFVTTTCTPLTGEQQAVTTFTRVQQFPVSGTTQTGPGTDVTTPNGPNAFGMCYAPGTQPALLPDGPADWTAADTTAYPSCTSHTWPCTVDVNNGNPQSINSLADVAQYYYITDLRPSGTWPATISDDVVPPVGGQPEDDKARWQHMTTFSIALGVSGTIKYVEDYKTSIVSGATDTPIDTRFADIRVGHDTAGNVANWPLWPDPALDYSNADNYNNPKAIDDFWHAAVNGRGLYFNAGNPTSVIAGLSGALAGINARIASSTGAGTSNLEPVPGDNFVYLANYSTQKWTGDVQAHEIDVNTGIIQSPIIWSAQTLLDGLVGNACDNRKIFLFRSGATNNLVNFTWNTQQCDTSGNPTGAMDTGLSTTEQANFGSTNVSLLSQYPSMTTSPDQRTPAVGANLVNFLRGQRGLENFTAGNVNKLYRKRDHVLGDIVDGQPVYVRAPFATYADTNYATFAAAQAGRLPMLYVASNDGMLHAFFAGTSATDTTGGTEAWAFIPSTMPAKLFTLADANYQNVHQYFVDGTPSVSDVMDSGHNWHTLLVGGLNDGGRSFYALDVTDPNNPKGMWEFNWSSTVCPANPNNATGNSADCHLGLSFGHPLISKLSNGTWVVMVTSGYNNVNASPQSGDGVGYLYVLNAMTGQIIYKIPTNVGDPTTPSGLAQINNFVDKADIDNTTVRVYGTDVLGNIWRFDVNDNTPPTGREATLVGTATDGAGTPQPITIRPELTQVGNNPMLFVASGKLFGATDVVDTQTQTIYGIIDPVTGTTAYPNLRSALVPLTMTQVGSGTGAYRTIACSGTTAACALANGWRVDLPDLGERVNVEMKLRLNTLIVGSNVPVASTCSAGGYSWLNYLNYSTGQAVTTSTNVAVSEQVANSLIVGLTVVQLSNGTVKAIITTSDAGVLTRTPPVANDFNRAKRISWREVVAP